MFCAEIWKISEFLSNYFLFYGGKIFGIFEPQRDKTYLLSTQRRLKSACARSLISLIRVFVVRMERLYTLDYSKCAQWRFWSDCVNLQADLNLRLSHLFECTFSEVASHMSKGLRTKIHIAVESKYLTCLYLWPLWKIKEQKINFSS